jgi:hypothetical protein
MNNSIFFKCDPIKLIVPSILGNYKNHFAISLKTRRFAENLDLM